MNVPTPRPSWADEPTQEWPVVRYRPESLAEIMATGHTAFYHAELGIWVRGNSAGTDVTPGQEGF